MVMLHRTRRVQYRQRALRFRLERIVRAPMVQIVTQAGHQQAEYLQIGHEPFHFASFEHCKHRLCHVQCVSPIMVFDRSIILPNAQYPSA
jgi:hypothetical protein